MHASSIESIREKLINLFGFKSALSLIWQSAPVLALINVFLIVLQGALPLASLYLIKMIVDSISFGIG
jgi:ATP-binding cassette, subfamily B, bacterial